MNNKWAVMYRNLGLLHGIIYLCKEHGMVVCQICNLLLWKSSKAKHANLICNMLPIVWIAKTLKILF